MRLSIATCLLIFGLSSISLAQNVEFKASNFKDEKEQLKAALENLKIADEILARANSKTLQIKPAVEEYEKALFYYKKAQQFNPNNSELNFKMGNCLLHTNRKYEAMAFLQKAKTLGGYEGAFLHYYLGWAHQLNGEFDKAIDGYNKFKSNAKGKDLEDMEKFVKKRIAECESGKKLVADPERVWVDNLKVINSVYDDYSPCISTDGEVLIFTSNRKNNHNADAFGQYDADIYSCTFEAGRWKAPVNLGDQINTERSETSSMLSYDGQKMLLYKIENDHADLYESELAGLTWSEAKPATTPKVNTAFNQTFASYNFDGVKIYYITDEEGGGGKRGNDIFFTGKMAGDKGFWGKGQTAGMKINTHFNEGSVYLHPDGQTMYFSSEGHNSMGGYDIFRSVKAQGQWGEPENLGYPINTPYDDLFFSATANEKFAFIASNRDGGSGGMDLYKVTFWGPEKKMILDTEDYLIASIARPIRNINLAPPVKVEKKSLTVFKGKVIDGLTREAVGAEIEITDNAKGEIISVVRSNEATGKFLLSLPSGFNYGIAVKAEGYLFHSENFDIPEFSEYNMVNKVVELKNINPGSKIVLRNIFFDSGKSTLRATSNTELNRLEKLLSDVSSLRVEISGHTDDVGNESANQKLSEERAQAVVDYLVRKGISKNRMEIKGYGETLPVESNATESGRQQNRRTEFKILSN